MAGTSGAPATAPFPSSRELEVLRRERSAKLAADVCRHGPALGDPPCATCARWARLFVRELTADALELVTREARAQHQAGINAKADAQERRRRGSFHG